MNDGRFDPLERVLVYDNFNDGMNGWMDLQNNYVLPGHKPRPSIVEKTQWGPSMISNLNFTYPGTHGAMSGLYALKVTTKKKAAAYAEPPAAGSQGLSVKRLSANGRGPTQFEMWYAYTPENDRIGLGENHIRAFGVLFDIQDSEQRYMIGARYLNSMDGEYVGKWQYAKTEESVTPEEWAYNTSGDWVKPGLDPQWYGRKREDGSADGWQFVPEGKQKLVYNESDDKINWQYLRLSFDTNLRQYTELQSLDRTFDLRGIQPLLADPYKGISGLLNVCVWIEADTDRRVFLYVDSAAISADYRQVS